jgi:hypothetical protein
MRLKAFIALALALSPMIATAATSPATVRFRTQVVHDRAPKARVHVIQARTH